MSLITQIFNYTLPYKRKVLKEGGSIGNDRLMKSNYLFFLQNELASNSIISWTEFAGTKKGKLYDLFSRNNLVQEIGANQPELYNGIPYFNGIDKFITIDVTGYNTIAIAYSINDRNVIITNALTELGEISEGTLYLGRNASGTSYYSFNLLAIIITDNSSYSLIESYLEALPLGAVLSLFANSETIFANDDKNVTVDGTKQSIEAWFDYMNEEFEKLYEIYT